MKKSIVLLVMLPAIWLAGCAGLAPPIEQDPNIVTLILKGSEKVDGRILDIQGDLIRFKPSTRVEKPHFGKFIRADEVKFVQLSSGSWFTVKAFIAYHWQTKSPAPLLGIGTTKVAQKEVIEATAGQDLQYEQLKKKAIAEMTPNEFSYFMLMKQQEAKAQPRPVGAFEPEKRVQPTQANSAVAKVDSAQTAPSTFSLTPFSLMPRAETKISKEEEAIIGLLCASTINPIIQHSSNPVIQNSITP